MTRQDLVNIRNSVLTALSNANDAVSYAEQACKKAKEAQAAANKALAALDGGAFTALYNSLPE